MEKIASFKVDHTKLLPGLHLSRKDKEGQTVVTTFDIRVTRPNFEPVMNCPEIHTIEHLGATFLRNHPEFGQKVVYFGPMGCKTGFYMLLFGDYDVCEVKKLVCDMFEFIKGFKGDIPGATAIECGNYLEQNLGMAKFIAKKYIDIIKEEKKND